MGKVFIVLELYGIGDRVRGVFATERDATAFRRGILTRKKEKNAKLKARREPNREIDLTVWVKAHKIR